MGASDLVIASNLLELRQLQDAGAQLRALESIDRDLRAHALASVYQGEQLVASVNGLANLERANQFILGDISSTLGLISDQICDGFWQVAYGQRVQSELLVGILQALASPSATQAKEYRERGIYAYKNGWIDDAEESLKQAATLDPFDFTVHQVLGDVLFKESRLGDAADEYAKAAKYARPVSGMDAGIGYVSQARALRAAGRGAEALVAATAALDLLPDEPDVNYAVAQSAASAGNLEEMANSLHKALQLKPGLAALAVSDAALEGVIDQVHQVLAEFRSEIHGRARRAVDAERALFCAVSAAYDSFIDLTESRRLETRQNASKKRSFWSSGEVDASQPWEVVQALTAAHQSIERYLSDLADLTATGAIIDSHAALMLIQSESPKLRSSTLQALRTQYAETWLTGAACSALVDAAVAIDPSSAKTAACPKCGKRVCEWDSACPWCGVLYSTSLVVPQPLESAYEAWLKDERHWPLFLSRLDANASALPKGPGARDKLAKRFPRAQGRPGFEAIAQKFEGR